MAGTKEGGQKAVKTNKARHGDDFYKKIGTMGGIKSKGGGFARNKELAREAGRKGGLVSRRGLGCQHYHHHSFVQDGIVYERCNNCGSVRRVK